MFRMKILLSFTIVLLIGITLAIPSGMEAIQARRGRLQPTLAPTPTLGPTPKLEVREYPQISNPLKTERDALKHLQTIDAKIAKWAKPWRLDSLADEPDRISIKWHSDRSFNGEYFGPGAEAGPVWVIMIRGNVMLVGSGDTMYDGISYTIGQKTGNLLGYDTGAVVK